MTSRRAQFSIRLLIGAALLLVTAVAAAHELEHALDQHDEPACALHLLAEHAGKAVAADVTVAPIVPYQSVLWSFIAASSPRTAVRAPRARSPPVSRV